MNRGKTYTLKTIIVKYSKYYECDHYRQTMRSVLGCDVSVIFYIDKVYGEVLGVFPQTIISVSDYELDEIVAIMCSNGLGEVINCVVDRTLYKFLYFSRDFFSIVMELHNCTYVEDFLLTEIRSGIVVVYASVLSTLRSTNLNFTKSYIINAEMQKGEWMKDIISSKKVVVTSLRRNAELLFHVCSPQDFYSYFHAFLTSHALCVDKIDNNHVSFYVG